MVDINLYVAVVCKWLGPLFSGLCRMDADWVVQDGCWCLLKILLVQENPEKESCGDADEAQDLGGDDNLRNNGQALFPVSVCFQCCWLLNHYFCLHFLFMAGEATRRGGCFWRVHTSQERRYRVLCLYAMLSMILYLHHAYAGLGFFIAACMLV
jgi:hypothetical protein